MMTWGQEKSTPLGGVGNAHVFPAAPRQPVHRELTGHLAARERAPGSHKDRGFQSPALGGGVPFPVVCAAPQWTLPAPPPAVLPQPTKVVWLQPPFSSPAGRPWPW